MVLLLAALVLHGGAPKKIWRWTAALAVGALVKPVVLPEPVEEPRSSDMAL